MLSFTRWLFTIVNDLGIHRTLILATDFLDELCAVGLSPPALRSPIR